MESKSRSLQERPDYRLTCVHSDKFNFNGSLAGHSGMSNCSETVVVIGSVKQALVWAHWLGRMVI